MRMVVKATIAISSIPAMNKPAISNGGISSSIVGFSLTTSGGDVITIDDDVMFNDLTDVCNEVGCDCVVDNDVVLNTAGLLMGVGTAEDIVLYCNCLVTEWLILVVVIEGLTIDVVGRLTADVVGRLTTVVVGRLTIDVVGRLTIDVVGRLTADVVGRLTADVVGRLTIDVVGRLNNDAGGLIPAVEELIPAVEELIEGVIGG